MKIGMRVGALFLLFPGVSLAWIPFSVRRASNQPPLAALPDGYQEFGDAVIRNVGKSYGMTGEEEDLSIEWKPGKIIVTVRGDVYVSTEMDEDEDEVDDEGDLVDVEDDEEDLDEGETLKEEEADLLGDENSTKEDSSNDSNAFKGVDVTQLAKAINQALDDGGIGLAIAEAHEIEVTTPGASEELVGNVMFDAYRGFDVICQQQDLKTKKIKQVEGKLVERNKEFTVVNIKGRMKKMKNDTLLSVKLPKAKTEKGVK